MLPLYQVLIVTVLGIIGAVLYLYKPDDPEDSEDKRQECRNCRNIGLAMVIVAAVGALYILFFSKISFRANMGNDDLALMQQQAATIQQPVPAPQHRRGVWDAVSDVGGKWVYMVGSNTQALVSAVAQNPDLVKQVTGSFA